jgi:FAS-associated factor 2
MQRAVALLFDDTPAASTSGQPPSAASAEPIATGRNIEQFDIEEPTSTPARRAGRSYGEIATNAIVYTLALPLTVAFNLVSYTFRFLRIPFPRLTSRPFHLRFNWNSFASLWRPPKYESPGVIAERWVRRLEDELGALTWGRAAASEEGPTKEIPDFYLGSYQDALMAAKRELKILCVILITDEHDDVPQFKMRVSLTFVRYVKLNFAI